MPVAGSFVINSGCLRVQEDQKPERVYLSQRKPGSNDLNPFASYNLSLDSLVVVDDGTESLSNVQSIVKSVENMAKNTQLVSALCARLNFAMTMDESYTQQIIVVTAAGANAEIHALRATGIGYTLTEEVKPTSNIISKIEDMTVAIPDTKVILLQLEANPMQVGITGAIVRTVKNWNEILFNGGMLKALLLLVDRLPHLNIMDFTLPCFYKINQQRFKLFDGFQFRPPCVYKTQLLDPGTLEVCERPQLVHDAEEGFKQKTRALVSYPIKTAGVYEIRVDIHDGVMSLNFNKSEVKVSKEAVPPPVKSTTPPTALPITTKKTDKSVETKKRMGEKAAVVYNLFSTNFCCSTKEDAKMIFYKLKTTPLTKKTDWSDIKAAERCEALFTGMPKDTDIGCAVLMHDGTFERKYVEQAFQKCKQLVPRVIILSETMAYLMIAASNLPTNLLKDGEVVVAFYLMGSFANFYYLKNVNGKLRLFDAVKCPMTELSKNKYRKLKDTLINKMKADATLIVSDGPVDALTNALKSESLKNLKYVQVENYGKASYEGGLAKARLMMKPRQYFDVSEFCGPTFYELGQVQARIFKEYQLLPKFANVHVDCVTAKKITVFQRNSVLSEKRYVVFEQVVPDDWNRLNLTVTAKQDGNVDVSIQKINVLIAAPKVPTVETPPQAVADKTAVIDVSSKKKDAGLKTDKASPIAAKAELPKQGVQSGETKDPIQIKNTTSTKTSTLSSTKKDFLLSQANSKSLDPETWRVFWNSSLPSTGIDLSLQTSKSTVGVAADKPIPSSGSTKDLIQIKSTRNSSLSSTMSDLSQQKNSSVAREAYKLPVHPFISKDCMQALSLPNSCCIRLILERNEVSVEVLKQSKCTYVRSPMRTNTVSACISFAGEKPCVGQTALQDKADHPEYVVSDILSILKTNKLSPDRDPKVHFKGNTCFIRCMTSFGERLIPRHVIIAVMLTALIRMAEKSLKRKLNEVFIMMPSSLVSIVQELRNGCDLAKVKFAGIDQYGSSFFS